ncbi:hypothetical protein GB2207_08781 [marine gamma proteobacterium HTCC2207]|jgi:uncharacterized membrane protein|uniref:DUF2306 domain-containing protein n=1 Tax=gamma proteobacterium HTCC2207 TaxID=314287 RepID=Q1YV17_9GAMM|nr:hypothetical protein GB2207_08781 [marine gamma proteobacterium HTCC2207] [gamma proteobacterium HTCC2207]MBT6115999.1 DUF2306 domain-containing protein [Porticoccaceae bacterium]MDC3261379.1 DUF2306 domain-containing protein [bacterium]MBT6592728.1 DUF2306 domain-containing protein [Porticoccaceae bacterium]MDB4428175.1 DUF2306 domain-containing protein [Porticoccaceae bacterium]
MSPIYIHAFFALIAVPVGLYILLTKKGTQKHKLTGRIWTLFLLIVSFTALFIQAINPGEYSLIHLLIPWTIGSLIYSIWSIRKFQKTKLQKYKKAHMYSMIGVYVGALLVAGVFTLMPGRLFYEILFS